tara:strand:+ start:4177 stop:4956 length:780 start_codon:yes stop_codon:yes gene_type:complete
MGFLNIYNNGVSGNTFSVYLTDYGKSLFSHGGGFFNAIDKFGLSDSDIDYRRFVGDGDCVSQMGASALTEDCFYDLPDARGGEETSFNNTYGMPNSSIMKGPRFDIQSGVLNFYNTSVGVNPTSSTIWLNYKKPEKEGEIENPNSGSMSSCWTLDKSVTRYFPSYCYTCADFNGDGRVDLEDLKIFLSLLGGSTKDSELVGDFNGDGKVDNKDLSSFLRCMNENNLNITDFCSDKQVFCVLCKQLGDLSPCSGDCLKCI